MRAVGFGISAFAAVALCSAGWWWPHADCAPIGAASAAPEMAAPVDAIAQEASEPHSASLVLPAPEPGLADRAVHEPSAAPAEPPADDAGTLLVRVVDAFAAPVADAEVVLVAGERDLRQARTDEHGRAMLPAAPAAQACRACAFGFLPQVVPIATATELQIELPRAPWLTGRVFAPDGRPQPGVEFVLLPTVVDRRGPPPALPPHCRTVQSDERGEFRLPWPRTTPHDLIGRCRGHAPLVVPALAPLTEGPLSLSLVRTAVVTGSAWDGARAVSHATIELWCTAASVEPSLGPDRPWHGGQLLASTTSDARGEFIFDELPEGRAWLTFGAGTGQHGHREVHVARGESLHVQLLASPRASVAGVVAGPAADARVFVFGGPLPLQLRAVGGDGAFAPIEVPPGRYLVGVAGSPVAATLHAALQELALDGRTDLAQSITLVAGEQRALQLTHRPVLQGSLTGMAFVAGRPASEHVIVLESMPPVGARRRRESVRPDGSFAMDALPVGQWQASLHATADGAALTTVPCRVLAGAVTQVALVQP